ncbi:tocopherol cyclase family protein [Microbacterium aoyamense]|uniref:Tocopherol cyclase family protein n=1 Tax=Microbacterium aoyamense TaxID=344166 RepID=A0ABN2PDT0_9MICO|nr:tocopherol cyclase family protein [Microbacterium aoyamense]
MRSPAAWLRGVRHPEAFHGDGVDRNYFEGWYNKLVSADRAQRWAVIPGIFKGPDASAEAFVQVLDGLEGRSWYHRFDAQDFHADASRFSVRIGPNTFDATGVTLDLPQLRGRLDYTTPLVPWPVTATAPGIMGWYGLVPFMECFHGIVSFGHTLAGTLEVEGAPVSFDGGRGYIEKDWGQAFPAGYVWMASNHTDADPEASLIASVAIIPWLRRSFRGSIIGFRHGGRLYRWTTYNRSRETRLQVDDTHVRWTVEGPDGVLELDAERVRGGLLHAPLRTAMHQRVEETLDARIRFRHVSSDGRVLLEGVAECAGLEVFGDTERLLALSR